MATYFTDFGSDTTGVAPSGWTPRWATTGMTYSVEEPSGLLSGKALRITSSGTNTNALLSWDAIDADANRANGELVMRWRLTADADNLRAQLRASGTSSITGYQGGAHPGASNQGRVAKHVSGSFTSLGTAAFTITANTWYWTRFRVNGTTLQLRMWADGGSEPGTWNIYDNTDGSISAAGWIGLMCGNSNNVTEIDCVGVGTNGDTAPTSAAGPATGNPRAGSLGACGVGF